MKTCKQLFDLYVDLFIKTKSWGTDINLEKDVILNLRRSQKEIHKKKIMLKI